MGASSRWRGGCISSCTVGKISSAAEGCLAGSGASALRFELSQGSPGRLHEAAGNCVHWPTGGGAAPSFGPPVAGWPGIATTTTVTASESPPDLLAESAVNSDAMQLCISARQLRLLQHQQGSGIGAGARWKDCSCHSSRAHTPQPSIREKRFRPVQATPRPRAAQQPPPKTLATPPQPAQTAAAEAGQGKGENGWQFDSVDFDALGLADGGGGEEAGGWQGDAPEFAALGLEPPAGEATASGAPDAPAGDQNGWQYESADFDGLGLAGAETGGQQQQSDAVEEDDAAPLHACWAALITAELERGLAAEALKAVDAAADKLVTCDEAATIFASAQASGTIAKRPSDLTPKQSYLS